MFKPLLTLGTCLLMASCTATPKESPMDTTLTLLPQASVPLGASHGDALAPAATLRFERVEDSRCPPDVRCISAGRLLYHFTLSGTTGKESFELEQDKPSHVPTSVPGVRIALAPVAPPPARPSTASGPAPAFPVTLTISRTP